MLFHAAAPDTASGPPLVQFTFLSILQRLFKRADSNLWGQQKTAGTPGPRPHPRPPSSLQQRQGRPGRTSPTPGEGTPPAGSTSAESWAFRRGRGHRDTCGLHLCVPFSKVSLGAARSGHSLGQAADEPARGNWLQGGRGSPASGERCGAGREAGSKGVLPGRPPRAHAPLQPAAPGGGRRRLRAPLHSASKNSFILDLFRCVSWPRRWCVFPVGLRSVCAVLQPGEMGQRCHCIQLTGGAAEPTCVLTDLSAGSVPF